MGGGGSKTTTTTTQQNPWAPQGVQLEYMLDEARRLYEAQKAQGPAWTGSRYAEMDPLTRQGLGLAVDYALGPQAQAASQMLGAGQQQIAAGQSYGANAQAMARGDFGPSASPSPIGHLTELALAGAGLHGIQSQDVAIRAVREAAARAGADRTGAIIGSAGRYSANPYLDAAIDAANRDVARQLSEDTLPTLNRMASVGGNLNSSRAGAAEAIATRGAADRMADTAAAMRQDAYRTGLQLGAEMDRFGTQALLGASDSAGSLASTGAGIAGNLASLLENRRQANLQGQLEANRQLGNALELGGAMANDGLAVGRNVADTLASVGAAHQAERQALLDDEIARAEQRPAWEWGLLNKFQGVVADNVFSNFSNGQRTETTKGRTSWLANALGLASIATAPLGFGKFGPAMFDGGLKTL